MGVKQMTKQELQGQVNMWQEFAASAVAFAQAAQKIADSYKPDIGEYMYISPSGAARLVGVSPARICNAIREGELNSYMAGVKVAEVMEWAQRPKRRKGLNTKIYHID